MLQVTLLSLILLSTNSWAGIGSVTEQKGVASISRNKSSVEVKKNTSVDSMDVVQTGAGVVGISFDDNTQVKVTENSKLVIDDFVYDPNNGDAGKLGLKVALGTARYASGQIAKDNPQNVKIETPTATIAVRGTDFSMTVDEVGSSTIVLLPNQDGTVGEIEVRTAMGSVVLNRAFQATVASMAEVKPLRPVILNLTESLIDNMMIVKPPKEILKAIAEDNVQAVDLLAYNALDYNPLNEVVFKDELKFNELNINDLDINYLTNALENVFDINTFQVGYNNSTQLYILDRNTYWYIERRVKDMATILINKDRGYDITLIQDGTVLYIKNQDSTTNKIFIKQGNK